MPQHQLDGLSYPHFALIYIDKDGNLCHETSQSLSNSGEIILPPEVTNVFLEAVARSMNRVSSHSRMPFSGNVHLQRNLQHTKKPHGEETAINDSSKALVTITDKHFLRRYYAKAFQNLQQTNCRILAKAYVKVVEPRKQMIYPYNGRKIIAGQTQQLHPSETKPPWWPAEVSHREPDHLPKAGKATLLFIFSIPTNY
jgi:hypothetical protein